ncbi:tetratricopeptide repeat protein [Helicobacter cetorum]|uniref:tetratricopeptide repeat protein n=1 Tax=Helicobacter cetorum TaxID=138563 RepID=UPI000CF1A7AC|nr:hypothetical protein [Helicobacter cetorum]
MKKSLFLLFSLPLFLVGEPSAFDMQSGATKKELRQLQTNNKNFSNVLAKLQAQVETNAQAQEGLKSIYEGQANKIKNLNDSILSQEESLRSLKSLQEVHANMLKQQAEILENLKKEVQVNQRAIKQLDKQTKQMNELLTKLSQDLVSKIALIQKSLQEQENQEKQEEHHNKEVQTTEISNQSPATDEISQNSQLALEDNADKIETKDGRAKNKELLQKALKEELKHEVKQEIKQESPKKHAHKEVSENKQIAETKPRFHKNLAKQKEIFEEALTFLKNKSYGEAKERFLWLEANSYRLAYVRYNLGEIAYAEKKYNDAIGYYKESALLDKKAVYMPILLWHTAWSFRRLNNHENYYKFLNTLQRLYPLSEQARMAKKILENKEKNHAKP